MNMMSTINDWNFPVEMMPTPTYIMGLDELNKVIAEQRGTTIADLALKDPNELPEGTTIEEAGSVSEMPKNLQQYKQKHRRLVYKHQIMVC